MNMRCLPLAAAQSPQPTRPEAVVSTSCPCPGIPVGKVEVDPRSIQVDPRSVYMGTVSAEGE